MAVLPAAFFLIAYRSLLNMMVPPEVGPVEWDEFTVGGDDLDEAGGSGGAADGGDSGDPGDAGGRGGASGCG
ncbi:MAG: hypothetical protein P8181_16590 [bacterium]